MWLFHWKAILDVNWYYVWHFFLPDNLSDKYCPSDIQPVRRWNIADRESGKQARRMIVAPNRSSSDDSSCPANETTVLAHSHLWRFVSQRCCFPELPLRWIILLRRKRKWEKGREQKERKLVHRYKYVCRERRCLHRRWLITNIV